MRVRSDTVQLRDSSSTRTTLAAGVPYINKVDKADSALYRVRGEPITSQVRFKDQKALHRLRATTDWRPPFPGRRVALNRVTYCITYS